MTESPALFPSHVEKEEKRKKEKKEHPSRSVSSALSLLSALCSPARKCECECDVM